MQYTQLLGAVQLSAVSKPMAAAVACTLDERPCHLHIDRHTKGPLNTKLVLSWAGSVSNISVGRFGAINTPGLKPFLAAAASLTTFELADTGSMSRQGENPLWFGGLNRVLGTLPCLENMHSNLGYPGWLPASYLMAKLHKLCAHFDMGQISTSRFIPGAPAASDSSIPPHCLDLLSTHLQARRLLEVSLGVSDIGTEVRHKCHQQLVQEVQGLLNIGSLGLRLRLSSAFPLDLQQCWQALSALQQCHLELGPELRSNCGKCNLNARLQSVGKPCQYSAHASQCKVGRYSLQALPRCKELSITVQQGTRGPLRLAWLAVTQQAGRVSINIRGAQELHIEGAAVGPPNHFEEPWQLLVLGDGAVHGLSGLQATAEGLLLQNAAALAAGQGAGDG